MKASRLIFAAICAGAILASCAPKEEAEVIVPAPSQEEVLPAQMCVISIDAVKGIDSKALALDGTKLAATWEAGEKVAVYKKGSNAKLGVLSPKTTGVASTSLEGEIDIAGLAVGDELFLLYPEPGEYTGWTYDGQDGTLETVSSDFDYATATVKVTSASSTHLSAESAAFKNQQAIVKFNLKDKSTGDALSTADFVILSKNHKLVRYHDMNFDPEPSDNFCYKYTEKSELTLAIATVDETADDYYFIATLEDLSGRNYYELLKEGVHFDHGKYYTGNLSLAPVTYTVAGTPASVFGSEWAPSLADNDMEFNGSYFSKYFPDIPAGTVMELKVAKNHAWGVDYPARNLIVTAWAEGGLEVTYSPFGNVVTAEMFYPGGNPATIPDVYTIAFEADGYTIHTPVNDLTAVGDGTYTYSTVADPGEWRFKIFKNRAYDVAEWPGPGEDPYYVNITTKSTLTVTLNPATNVITHSLVEYTVPDVYRVAGDSEGDHSGSDSIFGLAWDPINDANLMTLQADGKTYSKTYTAVPVCTVFEFKIVKNGNTWIPELGENYTYVNPAQGDVTISYNSESGEVGVSGPSGDIYRVAGDSEGDNSGTDAVFGTAWSPGNNANVMTPVDADTYVKVYKLVPAGTHLSFKIVKNGNEWSPGGNSEYTTTALSDVTIAYKLSTGNISASESAPAATP